MQIWLKSDAPLVSLHLLTNSVGIRYLQCSEDFFLSINYRDETISLRKCFSNTFIFEYYSALNCQLIIEILIFKNSKFKPTNITLSKMGSLISNKCTEVEVYDSKNFMREIFYG